MLEKEIWGNSLENWGISILIIVGAIIVTKLISLFNKKVVQPLTKKTQNKLDDVFYNAIESPIVFGVILLGLWVAINRLQSSESFISGVNSAYKILIVLNATWFFTRLIKCMIEVYWVNKVDTSQKTVRSASKMMPVVKRTIIVIIWVIGIIMALSNVGVNISALLGTLGIGGIAFALAAQDTIKNIFGAFTIFIDRPFSIGDTIRVDNFEGTIVDVGIRSTKMRDYNKRIITLPNYKIADASVINISSEPMRRVMMKLSLTYDTSAQKMNEAIDILKQIPSKVEHISSKDLTADFSEFTDSALVITFIYFIENKGRDIGKTISNVNMTILSEFNKAGLSFALNSQATLFREKKNS